MQILHFGLYFLDEWLGFLNCSFTWFEHAWMMWCIHWCTQPGMVLMLIPSYIFQVSDLGYRIGNRVYSPVAMASVWFRLAWVILIMKFSSFKSVVNFSSAPNSNTATAVFHWWLQNWFLQNAAYSVTILGTFASVMVMQNCWIQISTWPPWRLICFRKKLTSPLEQQHGVNVLWWS